MACYGVKVHQNYRPQGLILNQANSSLFSALSIVKDLLQAVKNSKPSDWGMDLAQQGSKSILAEFKSPQHASFKYLQRTLKAVQQRLPPQLGHGSLFR